MSVYSDSISLAGLPFSISTCDGASVAVHGRNVVSCRQRPACVETETAADEINTSTPFLILILRNILRLLDILSLSCTKS